MNFDSLIIKLQNRLAQPLPGEDAHRVMAPIKTDQRRFDLNFRADARTGAVLILLYPLGNDEIAFPLIQRPKYNGVHSGQIGLPGGKTEESDSNLAETALRETQEEVGVDYSLIRVLGGLTELYLPVSNFRITPIVGCIADKPTFRPDDIEVEEVIEAKISTILNEENVKVKDISVGQGISLSAPYFDVDSHVVWGATAMMISEFVSILKD